MATISTGGVNFQSGSAPYMQSWAGTVRSTFLAGGWVQTADAGQTNATALPAATAAGQAVGYEIWRMSDALQATAPVFVKVEYGSGTSVGPVALWITVGTGSDGAGNLTNVIVPRQVASLAGAGTLGGSQAWGSAASSRIAWTCGDGPNASLVFGIERNKNVQGGDASDAVLVMLGKGPTWSASGFAFAPFAGAIPSLSTNIGAFVPSGVTWALGNNAGACPVRYMAGGPSNPGLNFAVYLDGDLARAVPLQMAIYGNNHTYMPIGSNRVGSVVAGSATSSFLMLFE